MFVASLSSHPSRQLYIFPLFFTSFPHSFLLSSSPQTIISHRYLRKSEQIVMHHTLCLGNAWKNGAKIRLLCVRVEMLWDSFTSLCVFVRVCVCVFVHASVNVIHLNLSGITDTSYLQLDSINHTILLILIACFNNIVSIGMSLYGTSQLSSPWNTKKTKLPPRCHIHVYKCKIFYRKPEQISPYMFWCWSYLFKLTFAHKLTFDCRIIWI